MENPQEETLGWQSSVSFATCKSPRTARDFFFKPGNKIDFRGYSDADWAGDLADRKSTSGYTFVHADEAPVSWGSKKQSSVCRCLRAKRSYIALSLAIQEGKWIHRLLCEILAAANETGPELMIREDNQSCIKMTKNPVERWPRQAHRHQVPPHPRRNVKRGEVEAPVLRDFRDAGGHHDEGARGTTPHGPHGGSRHSWDFALRGRIESYRFGIGY
ncbi:hypothetical protein Pcac1_g21199 [Phytophthora cactorum]|nr:hypothetical protein Pcac1_g21199 [Phytophthora cactorum]